MASILDCLCIPSRKAFAYNPPTIINLHPRHAYLSEKMVYYCDEPIKCTEAEAADKSIDTLYSADKAGKDLQHTLEDVVNETGWWDAAIAKAVLAALEKTLQAGKAMKPALRQAYDKAVMEAKKMEELAEEHPVLTGVFCTVVALGVLELLWPEMIAALGFGELGPVEGTIVLLTVS